jgi:hypothetical protein
MNRMMFFLSHVQEVRHHCNNSEEVSKDWQAGLLLYFPCVEWNLFIPTVGERRMMIGS